MARPKRNSPTLEKALRRIAGMRWISPTLDFGKGLNVTEYDNLIQNLQNELSSYNTLISTLDEKAVRISQIEEELNRYSEKMLMSVATNYGKDSLQYAQAGGKPRKSSSRRSKNSQPSSETTVTPLNGANKNGKKSSVVLP
jgi:DNA primase